MDDQTQDKTFNRRAMLYYTTGAAAATVTGVAGCGLLNSLAPAQNVLANAELGVVDFGDVPVGAQQMFIVDRKPLFVLHMNEAQRQLALADDALDCRDPYANNENLEAKAAATLDNRVFGEFLVLWGLCTRWVGCVPMFDAGDFEAWFCPCCAAHYDFAGRIRKGIAPRNMAVPRYDVLSPTKLRILSAAALMPT